MTKYFINPTTLLFLIFFIIILTTNTSYADQYISIRNVIEDNSKDLPPGYIFGKTKYDKWEYVGLNEYFKIKVETDAQLEPNDLTKITLIYKERESSLSSVLLMELTIQGAEKMKNISTKYQEKRVSIDIGNEIISVPTIVGYLSNNLKLYFDIEKFENVSQLLNKSYNNVEVIN